MMKNGYSKLVRIVKDNKIRDGNKSAKFYLFFQEKYYLDRKYYVVKYVIYLYRGKHGLQNKTLKK